MSNKPRESNWYKIDVCKNCRKRLRRNARCYSGGVCPKCGHDSCSTICDTSTVIIKEILHPPWWRVWDKEYEYIGRDEFSREWLNNN